MLHFDDRLSQLVSSTAGAPVEGPGLRGRHRKTLSVSPPDNGVLSAESALELVGSVLEALVAGRADALSDLCSSNIHARLAGVDTSSLDDLLQSVNDVPRSLSDIDILIDSLIVSDAHLSAEWQLRARHTGALQAGWMSLEPTGRAVAIDGALIGHVSKADADAARVHVFDDLHLYYDTASLLLQLGF
jgi:hypothetical protein